MFRKQIYLPRCQLKILQKEAQKKSLSVSACIRQILDEQLHGKPTRPAASRQSLLKIVKKINEKGLKAPKDLADNLDRYLYGR